YRRRWHQPEARFVRDHLAFHLAEAGRTAELTELVTDVRWMLARLADSGPPALEADLARSPGPRAAAALRHLRRVGHLLGDLDARGPTESNRLAHLATLPEVRAAAERAPLILRWRRPEPPPARAVAAHAAPVWGWRSRRTAPGSPPGPTMRRHGCGAPTGARSARSAATPAR